MAFLITTRNGMLSDKQNILTKTQTLVPDAVRINSLTYCLHPVNTEFSKAQDKLRDSE